MSRALLASLLPLAVAIPLGTAAVTPLAARASRQAAVVLPVVSLVATSVLLLLMAPTVFGGHMLSHFMGHWAPIGGNALGIAFSADAWGLTFALVTAVLGTLLSLYSLSELCDLGPKELGGYSCLFLLLCAALIGGALTGDLFNLFVWFEVAALASYALTGFFLERPIALEASFKVLVLTTLASFAIFIGAVLLYADHGALNFGQLHVALAQHEEPADLAALALLVGGFATKAGLVPFHGWLADAHTAAPGPVSALFSGLMVNLGIVAIGRIVFEVYTPALGHHILGLLMVIGLVSAVGGAFFALVQDDLKRLLAYDTISQMGILAVGLATGTARGLAGTTYHLLDHALFKALLFLCAGSVVHMTGATKLSEMGGLIRRNPFLAGAFSAGVLSIAGIPPFDGYVSLGLIHDSLRTQGEWIPLSLMLVAQIITMAALGKAAWQGFYRRRAPDAEFESDEKLRPGMATALVALSGACVVLGVLPGTVLSHLAAPAAGALLDPTGYSRAVLASGGTFRRASVTFDYASPLGLGLVVGTAILAVPVAVFGIRWNGVKAVMLIRRVQSGSVNDYAGYLALGLVVALVVLASGALF